MKKHPYYNIKPLLGYNATYNMVAGSRGLGKTFGFKDYGIKRFFKTGEQFIYLRRYKSEVKAARTTFFSDIEYKFPGHVFRVEGSEFQTAPCDESGKKTGAWKTMGYIFALSVAQSLKSVNFPLVKTIIFDEFILEKGMTHYLPNEVTVFNNFYSTVDRNQDKTKVFFLANAVSIMNPYFIEYEIEPDSGVEFISKFKGFLVCHFPQASNFKDSVNDTNFGRFIRESSPDYADYAVDNKFLDNTRGLIEKKDQRSKYWFTIETEKGVFSVWHNHYRETFFIQSRLPKYNLWFTMVSALMTEDKQLIGFSDKYLQVLRTGFRSGRVVFDKPSTRNVFAEIFKR